MHDEHAQGEGFFKCDFCRQPWSEERPMVEGHRGSLICGPCLTVAYAELCLHDVGYEPSPDEACSLCLESARPEPHWQSPVHAEAIACRRCIKQSAGVLQKDREIDWSKPTSSS